MHIALMSTVRSLVSSLACLTLLVLSGCQSSQSSKGKLSGDVYTSPHGNFSMSIPLDSSLGRRIQDDARALPDKEGFLTVHNDSGVLRSVQWAALSAGTLAEFNADLPGTLRAFYPECVVALIDSKCPGTRSLRDEPLPDAPIPAHFGVVSIPKGSTLMKADSPGTTAEPLDTVRAYLVFVREGYAYILGCATSADAMNADVTLTPARIDEYKRILGELRSSMRFPAAP
jgi:hypothetical protein